MDIDLTFIIQLIIFLVVFAGLNALILKPFLRVIEERERRISGANQEADRLSKLVIEDRDAYKARLKEARSAAHRDREAMRAVGRDQGRKLVKDVRHELTQAMSATQEKVGDAEKAASCVLEAEVDGLARQVVEKVLGRRLA